MSLIEKAFRKEEARLFLSNQQESQESENFCSEVFLTPDQLKEACQNNTLLRLDQLVELLAKAHRDYQGWPGHRRAVYQDLIPNVKG